MPITEKQLGQAFKRCREKLQPSYSQAAVSVGLHPDSLRHREQGRVPIRLSEFLQFAESWGVDPVELLTELLLQSDLGYWEKIADQLGCTIPMAKQRLAIAQKQHSLTRGQVWQKYLDEQIRL